MYIKHEITAYSGLLGAGNYMIVEDSNLNGHPLSPSWHVPTANEGGPFEAIEEFMQERHDFTIDPAMEQRFLFSFAPSGYLKKLPLP